jgi:cyclopropane fatty-acyl-phospholipid synthase-like methyltransferase
VNIGDSLLSNEWASLYVNGGAMPRLMKKVSNDDYTTWTREMLKFCVPGDRVCELGVGSGETSLALAKIGCKVTCVDFSEKVLAFVQKAAAGLGYGLACICRDVRIPCPQNEMYDVIFSCGLLEHFESDERTGILRAYRRNCKKMICMIPNAASLAYALGKEQQEMKGIWPYGKELPAYSMIKEFISAGYSVEEEYSIGELDALTFLREKDPLRQALSELWHERRTRDRENACSDFHQGYLLVTVGGIHGQSELAKRELR